MRMTHYTTRFNGKKNEHGDFDPARRYPADISVAQKPTGLWLSDDRNYGWAQYSKDSWPEQPCEPQWIFEVDMDRILVVDDSNLLDMLKMARNSDKHEDHPRQRYPWRVFREQWAGVYFSPHEHKFTEVTYGEGFDTARAWILCWDCDSACVWDLSAVRLIDDGIRLAA